MLDLAAELAHVGHWVWNRDTNRIAYCSEELARIHDLAPAMFLTKFTHPERIALSVLDEDRPNYQSVLETALANAEPPANLARGSGRGR